MFRKSVCAAALSFAMASTALAGCAGPKMADVLAPDQLAELRHRAAADPYGQGNMWKATRDGHTVWLIGTMHVYDPRLHTVMDSLYGTLADSDLVMLELDSAGMKAVEEAPVHDPDRFFINDGDTLPVILSKEDWAATREALSDLGIPAFFAAKFRLWFLNMTLMTPPCMLADKVAGYQGLDEMILDHAEDYGVPTASLDDPETLLGLFEEGTREEHIRALRATLDQWDDTKDGIAVTIDAYFNQEARLAWEYSLDQVQETDWMTQAEIDEMIDELFSELLEGRNLAWVDKITAASETHETVTVAVGVMHFSTEVGLPKLLAERGFTVERFGQDYWP